MKRIIVDYQKLNNDLLNLLVEKFPDGYDTDDIIVFRNAKNEVIEAVEVRTEDTVYLVKVSQRLADTMENYDEGDEDNDGLGEVSRSEDPDEIEDELVDND